MARMIHFILLLSLIALAWGAPRPQETERKEEDKPLDPPGQEREKKPEQLPPVNDKQAEEEKVGEGKEEDKKKESETNQTALLDTPQPFLLQGAPIQTPIRTDGLSPAEQQARSKRDTHTTVQQPTTDKSVHPLQHPHLDPTPPPGYKPRPSRDTEQEKISQQPSSASLAHEGVHGLPEQKSPQADAAKKEKRDTAAKSQEDKHNTAPSQSHQPQLSPPLAPPPPFHVETENNKHGVIYPPPIPGIPVSPKQKRDVSKSEEEKQEKSDTKNEKVDQSEKKEEHKEKRDSYSLKENEKSSDLHPQEHPAGSDPKLTPPVHESEYNRHARDAEKDSSISVEHSPEEKEKSGTKEKDNKSELPDEKKDI